MSSIISDNLMFLCFKWRWRHEQGLECSTYLEEYNQEVDKFTSRDRPQPSFSLARVPSYQTELPRLRQHPG
jgi:hypothetical protein